MRLKETMNGNNGGLKKQAFTLTKKMSLHSCSSSENPKTLATHTRVHVTHTTTLVTHASTPATQAFIE